MAREIPARGLIGLRSRMLTATAGEAVMYHSFQRYAPARAIDHSRQNGVMIATEPGVATTYSLLNLSERGVMFMSPQDPVYAGQIVGENRREKDMNVNVTRPKKLTNVRAAGKDEAAVLTPPRALQIEWALEWMEDDELLEVTPANLRLRKRVLPANLRKRI